jgi:predicted phosphodiesterase
MKYGIISDVHSNLEALDTAISKMKNKGVESIICCGDIVGYGPDPEECITIFKELPIHSVIGNHDYAINCINGEQSFNTYARLAIRWTRKKLSKNSKTFLKNLPFFTEQENFTIFHGTLDEKNPFKYLITAQDAVKNFKNIKTHIGFFGHSHVAGYFMQTENKKINYYSCIEDCKLTLQKDNQYLINVGSVGQPRDGNPEAAFAIYDTSDNTIEIVRFQYDIEAVYKKIIKARLPNFLGDRLFSGV